MSVKTALAAALLALGSQATIAVARGTHDSSRGTHHAGHGTHNLSHNSHHNRRAHGARSRRGRAHGASTMRVSDHGHLRFHSAGATVIVDVGRVSGTIPGYATVHFHYNGSPKVTATFAIRARGGTLYGRARCRLHNPTSPTPSYRGALILTGGSGRYAHAKGSGQMYGVFHRRGYALTVHAEGTLRR